MKQSTFKILKIIFEIFCILLALIAVYNIYSLMYNTLNDTKISNLMGYSLYTVSEGNMSPDYNPNDVIIVEDKDYYAAEDIVLFEYYDSLKIGKITDLGAGYYRMEDKTDSINHDYKITDDIIVGKVTTNIKGFGKIYSILTTPYSIGVIIIVIAAYFGLTAKVKIKED